MSKTHRMSKSPEYRAYHKMKQRCATDDPHYFPHYKAKGITVCPEWDTFEALFIDMGVRPGLDYSLERKEGHLGYSKNNCTWATVVEQQNNKSSNVVLTAFGKTQTLTQWSRELKLTAARIRLRLRRGATTEFALSIEDHPMLRRAGTKQKIKTSDWRKST